MSDLSELFWNASIEELKRGFIFNDQIEVYICLVCGEEFNKGQVYPVKDCFYEAEKFAGLHIEQEHSSMLDCLLSLDKKLTGLSDIQKNLVELFNRGLSDKEIMKELGSGSTSTIRNHRFALREKMKQAKVFLAIMEQVEEKTTKQHKFIYTHQTPTMVDQRYAITQQENEELLNAYFKSGLEGDLSRFPRKQKQKVAILTHIAKRFKANQSYSESELNSMLEQIYPDYVTIRRYMIDYGFLDRLPDGSKYWIKTPKS